MTTWRLIMATAGGAVTGGIAADARRAVDTAMGKLALALVMAVAKGQHLVAVVVFREAPDAATVFPKRLT